MSSELVTIRSFGRGELGRSPVFPGPGFGVWVSAVELFRRRPMFCGRVGSRAAAEVARRLGVELTMFPGGHAGFTADGYGTPGDPEGFAAVLRELLG
ncbi:hypothetical protein [Rhodococcus sp. SJ-2]